MSSKSSVRHKLICAWHFVGYRNVREIISRLAANVVADIVRHKYHRYYRSQDARSDTLAASSNFWVINLFMVTSASCKRLKAFFKSDPGLKIFTENKLNCARNSSVHKLYTELYMHIIILNIKYYDCTF